MDVLVSLKPLVLRRRQIIFGRSLSSVQYVHPHMVFTMFSSHSRIPGPEFFNTSFLLAVVTGHRNTHLEIDFLSFLSKNVENG